MRNTVVDDVVVGFEDAVRKPVVSDELPDVFLRVQLGDPPGGDKR